jgi:hypothetical protein
MNPNEYTGKGDSFLDFSGNAADFGSEANFDKVFQITITNASVTDLTVLLNPSYKPTLPLSVVADGNIAYASGKTDLSGAGSPNTIAELHAFIRLNPSTVVKTVVKSNNANQLSQAFLISKKNPFATVNSERINLVSALSEFATNDKLATVKREFILSDQHELSTVVPAAVGGVSTVTTFTFYFGATLNSVVALAEKKCHAVCNRSANQSCQQVNQ